MWTVRKDETGDAAVCYRGLKQAADLRASLLDQHQTNAYRVVNGESDGLPGLIVDRYGKVLVVQFLSAGSAYHKESIVHALKDLFPEASIYERSDADVRRKEGLPPEAGLLAGEAFDSLVEIKENNLRFLVDIWHGHKTGFYLDQRVNRELAGQTAKDKTVLNCFSYTGGFAVYALAGGAKQVVNVDTSRSALDLSLENIKRNGLDTDRCTHLTGDVFQVLRRFKSEDRRFDMIILDPPKFVFSAKDLMAGSRGYQDINRLAFELLNPGGLLFTFSCSGLMKRELFQKIVADAALEAGRKGTILRFLQQAADHPVALSFPEGFYLKGLLVGVE